MPASAVEDFHMKIFSTASGCPRRGVSRDRMVRADWRKFSGRIFDSPPRRPNYLLIMCIGNLPRRTSKFLRTFRFRGSDDPLNPRRGHEAGSPHSMQENISFHFTNNCKSIIKRENRNFRKKSGWGLHYTLEFLLEEIEAFLDVLEIFSTRKDDLA